MAQILNSVIFADLLKVKRDIPSADKSLWRRILDSGAEHIHTNHDLHSLLILTNIWSFIQRLKKVSSTISIKIKTFLLPTFNKLISDHHGVLK